MSDSKKIVVVLAKTSIKIRKTNPKLCALNCPHLSGRQNCHLFNITNHIVADDTYMERDEYKVVRNSRCVKGESEPALIEPGRMTWEKGG